MISDIFEYFGLYPLKGRKLEYKRKIDEEIINQLGLVLSSEKSKTILLLCCLCRSSENPSICILTNSLHLKTTMNPSAPTTHDHHQEIEDISENSSDSGA